MLPNVYGDKKLLLPVVKDKKIIADFGKLKIYSAQANYQVIDHMVRRWDIKTKPEDDKISLDE